VISASFAELVMALWPVLAAIVCGFCYGLYVWVNTRRDVDDALKLGEQNAQAIANLSTKHEQHSERLARLEAQQKEIVDGIKWMRANWWPRRNRKN
jgi:hypothetical protein